MDAAKVNQISAELFKCVDRIIGNKQIIKSRRLATKLGNEYAQIQSDINNDDTYIHISGSYAEGFRLRSSDRDFMCIVKNIKVLSSEDTGNCSYDNTTLLLECDTSLPGFVKLRVLSESSDSFVTRSCVNQGQNQYVSSAKWNRAMPHVTRNGKIHGPCQSGILGVHEVDFAVCLHCDRWPTSAHGFLKRMLVLGWPPVSVLKTIIAQGCHLVAIGSKFSSSDDLEWRLSFSFAEELLINEMNHCQFLCYGLLKIFLKEAIESDAQLKNSLCSYFMKTVVLWEMTNRSLNWEPSCLLQRFWSCLSRLIMWVSAGYCPNFFIAENNMFLGKIEGPLQRNLLTHLMIMYKEGYSCLLRMPSLREAIIRCVKAPVSIVPMPSEESKCSKEKLDCCYIQEFTRFSGMLQIFPGNRGHMETISSMLVNTHNRTLVEICMLKFWERYFLQYSILRCACIDMCKNHYNNKTTLEKCHRTITTLKKLFVDVQHHRLLTAIYLYRLGCTKLAVDILQKIKLRMQTSEIMYTWNISAKRYRHAGGDHVSLPKMLAKFVVCQQLLDNENCLPELRKEFQAAMSSSTFTQLTASPLMLCNFLLYLSFKHEGRDREARELLEEFTLLVNFDDSRHIPRECKSLAFEMLGICQEIDGNFSGAKKSYNQSLRSPFNRLASATKKRLYNLQLMKDRMKINDL